MSDATEPPIPRERLHRILALPEDAGPEALFEASRRLLAALEARREGLPREERAAVEREIAQLRRSTLALLAGSSDVLASAAAPPRAPDAASARGRPPTVALLAAVLLLVGLLGWAAGFRVTRPGASGSEVAAPVAAPGTLLLTSPLPGATLRVLDADRAEVLVERPAEQARVELPAGRYALEVQREDCPDRWTRSVYFEPGSVHRFAPEICRGEGRLVVRSNVVEDRLRIDGLDVGGTGTQAHRLAVGDHEIRVEKPGYRPFEGRVRIAPDERIELRAELVPLGSSQPTGRERPLPVTRPEPARPAPTTAAPLPYDLEALRDSVAPDVGARKLDPGLLAPGRELRDDGGSSLWHARVSRELLARFDLDGSGRIDRLEESEAIPCSTWQAVEADFDRGGLGLPMTRYYGFDGSEWRPGALGFDRSQRSAAFAKMKECGLQSTLMAPRRLG